MSNVVQFWGHKYHSCDDPDCGACNGGLAFCVTCRGAEGSLPTHCPGHKMDDVTEDAVYGGSMDFFRGNWIVNGVVKRREQDG